MARLRVGALIVVERSMRLGDMIEREGRAAGRAPEQAAFDEYFSIPRRPCTMELW